MVTPIFGYLTHSNFNLPSKLDKIISLLFVTPKMHKFHHHHKLPWTDSNYGNVFSIWDRIFGTLVYDNENKIVFGLDSVDETKSDNLLYQLKLPFIKDDQKPISEEINSTKS